MIISLFGGILYVQILDDIQYPSDLEHEYDLWVVTFVLEDMGEVLSYVIMCIWYSFDILMICMLLLPLVLSCERRLHDTSPYLGLREGIVE